MRSETFQTPGPVRLNLELPAGSIEVETADTQETHVDLEAISDREQVREMVDDARIETVRRGDGHEVIVEVRTRHGVWVSFSKGPDLRLGSPETVGKLVSTIQGQMHEHEAAQVVSRYFDQLDVLADGSDLIVSLAMSGDQIMQLMSSVSTPGNVTLGM